MDAISNQLFSFELGVQPNKDTFQNIAAAISKGLSTLATQGQSLLEYADTLEANKFISGAPAPRIQEQLTTPQIKYIEAAPTAQAAKARRAKVLREPVVWQITEKQMKELQWKRKQLLQAQKKELDRKKAERAKRGPPPKLGPSKKNGGVWSSAASSQVQGPTAKAQTLKSQAGTSAKSNPVASKGASGLKPPGKVPAKPPPNASVKK